jgi:hypothetical protein
MKKMPKITSICFALTACAGLLLSAVSSHAQGAAATISDVPASGGYDYTIILQNTGTTSLEGFWYAWTTSGNNLPSTPSTLGNTLGWGESVFGGHSIQWQGNSGNALAAGNSGTFTFFSPDSPAAITTSPSGESVVYVGTIGFNQNQPGTSSPVFSPTLVTAPEPSAMALLAVGALGIAGAGWRRVRGKQ